LNYTLNLSAKIEELLNCQGSTNLVDVFELHPLINEMYDNVDNELNYMLEERELLNQTDSYDSMTSYLHSMQNNSIQLNYGSMQNITLMQQELYNITLQLDNLSNFNFSEAQYNASLAAVNQITNNLVLNNGTELYIYYDSSNITTLDCEAAPYNDIDASTQDDLCNKSAEAIAMTIERDEILTQITTIRNNITDIDMKLEGFIGFLNSVNTTQQNLTHYANDIQDNLDLAYAEANAVMATVSDIVTTIRNTVNDGINNVLEATRCYYIEKSYEDLTNSLCTVIRPTFQVVAAMMLVGACSLFFGAIISALTIYQVERLIEY